MAAFWNEVRAAWVAFAWYEWVALVTGVVYVWLAARQLRSCWYWGILSCLLWAYADFFYYLLYLDAILQIFYVGMGIWGILQWSNSSTGQGIQIERIPWREHLKILALIVPGSLFFGYFFDAYTPAAATYADAFTTIAAIVATWLTVKRKLENWWYWMVIDVVYIGITWSRGAYLYALLYLIYTFLAIFGWIAWKKQWMIQIKYSTAKDQ